MAVGVYAGGSTSPCPFTLTEAAVSALDCNGHATLLPAFLRSFLALWQLVQHEIMPQRRAMRQMKATRAPMVMTKMRGRDISPEEEVEPPLEEAARMVVKKAGMNAGILNEGTVCWRCVWYVVSSVIVEKKYA